MAITTFVASQILTAAQMNAVQGNDYNQTVSTKTASYTLVAADKGTRIVMNVTGASTVTVNTSLFSAGDTLTIQNISATACTLTAGTATVSSAGPLAIPQNGSGLLYFTSAGVSIFYPSAVTAAASGLVCVQAETAFSAVASVTADSVFTSTFTNYRIIIRYTTSAEYLDMRFRVAGVDTSTNYNFEEVDISATTVSAGRNAAVTAGRIGHETNGASFSLVSVDISGPQLAEGTAYFSNNALNKTYALPRIIIIAGNQSASTSFDGVKFLVTSGTMTGSFTIYGYSETV